MSSDDTTIAVIEEQADKSIRRREVDGIWYFSVIDVIAVLTDSASPSAYWRKLKQRLKEEGSEVVTNCHGLKLPAADGKQYVTDTADTETLLRLIQSVPSPKAEPIKQWLAKVGADKLQSMAPVPLGSSIAELKQNKPPDDADAVTLADYYEQLAALYRRQAHLESRLRIVESVTADHTEQLDSIQSRLEGLEEETRMLPELLERLGPERLKPEHQALVKRWVQELHSLAGYAYGSIYGDFNGAFHVGKFSDVLETDWERVEQWFIVRIEAAKKRTR